MSDSALIDDLERQFAENPRRVFARLANEYRKAGDAERAIDICLSHVPQQPGYISGHIVLGQALFDTGRYDEAKSAFETALGLDPENLIALRQLGDIARETGSSDDARSWYRRLLEVDPQNEEIAAQLQALDESAGPTPDVQMVDAAPEPVSWGDIHPEGPGTEPATPVGDVVALDNAPADDAAREDASAGVIANDVGLEVEQAFPAMFATDPSAVTLQGDVRDDAGELEPVRLDGDASSAGEGAIAWETDESTVPPIGFEPTSIELPDPIEPQEPPAIDPAMDAPGVSASTPPWLASAGDHDPAELGAEGMAAGMVADTGAALPDVEPLEVTPTEVVFNMPDDAESQEVTSGDVARTTADGESAAPSDAFVTETMADLYLQQGFTARALDVYLQLAAQYPDNPRFQEQIALLREAVATAPNEAGAALNESTGDDDWCARPPRTGPTIRAFLSAIAARGAVAPRTEWTPESEPAGMDASDTADASVAAELSATGDVSVATETATDVAAEIAAAPYQEPLEEPPAPDATPANSAAIDAPDTSDIHGMFPGWTVSAEDDVVGQALDEAYADADTGGDGRDGMPSHRADDELSLDAIFRDAARRDGGQNGQGVSFDEFFADDDNQGAERTPGTANGNAGGDDGASADLELFHAWLEGLKK